MKNDSLIYLLDTNVCIMYLKGKSPSINHHLDNLEPEKIAVCSVVKAELFYGFMRSNNPQKVTFSPFGDFLLWLSESG